MSVYDEYEPPQSTGLFLGGKKFEEGKQYRLRIASDPVIFHVKYQGRDKPQIKYAWKVYNFDAKAAQILQLPVTAYLDIKALATSKDWGDPTTYTITIKREGSELETRYEILPTPSKQSLTDHESAAVDAIDIIEEIGKGNGVEYVSWLAEHTASKNSAKAFL